MEELKKHRMLGCSPGFQPFWASCFSKNRGPWAVVRLYTLNIYDCNTVVFFKKPWPGYACILQICSSAIYKI